MDTDHAADEPPEWVDVLSDSGSDSELDEGEWVTGEAIDWSTDPDAMSWEEAASARVDDQPSQQRAVSFGSCAPCSEAAGGFRASCACPTPAHLSAALAGGALAGAYASGADGAAERADTAASDSGITESTVRPPQPVVEASIPTDLCWPSADRLEVTAAVSELAATGGAASHVEVDARLPTFRVEMKNTCNCNGTDTDCLLELWNKPDSEAWASYRRCEAAEARVRDIVKNKPRRRAKDSVKTGFDVIGGYVGSNGTHASAGSAADASSAADQNASTQASPASTANGAGTGTRPAASAQGALKRHRLTLAAAKTESNRVAEEEIVRLDNLKLFGPDRKGCLETLCYLVRRGESWLRQRPRKRKGEAVRRPSRLHRLGLGRYADRTSMDSLCRLEDLALAECKCGKHCLFNAKPSDLHYFRRQLRAAMRSGDAEQKFEVVQGILIYYEGICTRAVQLITGHSRQTIDRYREYASLGAFRAAHGNTGRSTWNTSAPWVNAAIADTLNVCTMKDPEAKVRRPVNTTAAGIRKMYDLMCSGKVQTGRTVADLRATPTCTTTAGEQATTEEAFADRARSWCSLSKFASEIAKICRSEGCKLLRAQTGHNKCPYCLEMEQEILSTHAELEAARKAQFSDPREVEQLRERHEQAKAKYREHLEKDYWTRGYVNCMMRLAEAVNETYDHAMDGVDDVDKAEFGAYMMFVHMDDRSDKDVPDAPVQTEMAGYANPTHIHGQHDHVDNTADIFLVEPGGGSKTTSCVKDEWYLNIITRCKQQRPQVVVAESDCGPLQRNAKMVKFGRWLVDSGHCKFFVLIYHEERHSKGPSDGDFGHMTIAMESEPQFGADCIGHTVAGLPREESREEYRMRPHLLHPNMKCEYDEHEDGLYKFVGGLGKAKDNIHTICIGHEYSALSDTLVEVTGPKGQVITTSLRAEMKKIGPQGELDADGNAAPGTVELWEYPPRSACLTYVDAGEISVQNGKVVADATSNASHVTEPTCQPLQQATGDNELWRWESEDGLPSAETWLHNMAVACDAVYREALEHESENEDEDEDDADPIDLTSWDEDEEETEDCDRDVMVERDGTKHRSFQMWKPRPVLKKDTNVRDKPKVGKRGVGMLPSQADHTGHNGHRKGKVLSPWLRAGGLELQNRLYQADLVAMYGDRPSGPDTADELFNGKTLRVASDKWISRPPASVARAPSKLCAEAMVAAALKVRRNGTEGWVAPTWEYEAAPKHAVHVPTVSAGGFYAPALQRLQNAVDAMPADAKIGIAELRAECCIENGCPIDGLAQMIAAKHPSPNTTTSRATPASTRRVAVLPTKGTGAQEAYAMNQAWKADIDAHLQAIGGLPPGVPRDDPAAVAARARGRYLKRQQRRAANARKRARGAMCALPRFLRTGTTHAAASHNEGTSEADALMDTSEDDECSVAAGYVGKTILQTFTGYEGEFEGKVTDYQGTGNNAVFTVEFEDGDQQRYTLAQMRACFD